MKIVISGGSGQIGQILARALQNRGDEVVVLSRNSATTPTPTRWRTVQWDGKTLGEWAAELEGADAVINLAGQSVNCRYNPANRQLIKGSRLDSTKVIGEAICKAANPPKIWLQSGTATIYAQRYDTANDEASGILGGQETGIPDTWRFSIDVAKSWEAAVNEAIVSGTRKVILRTAMVMSPDRGGVFDVFLKLVRFGLGGTFGDGRQYVSWIHVEDFIRAVLWLIEHSELEGPFNLAAPHPVPNSEFMRKLRKAARRPVGLPAASWMLEIGAFFLRTETELILKSRRVVPGRLLESGFRFVYPNWEEAAENLYQRREFPDQLNPPSNPVFGGGGIQKAK